MGRLIPEFESRTARQINFRIALNDVRLLVSPACCGRHLRQALIPWAATRFCQGEPHASGLRAGNAVMAAAYWNISERAIWHKRLSALVCDEWLVGYDGDVHRRYLLDGQKVSRPEVISLCALSSTGQSNGLLSHRSGVRVPQGAPRVS